MVYFRPSRSLCQFVTCCPTSEGDRADGGAAALEFEGCTYILTSASNSIRNDCLSDEIIPISKFV